MIWRRRWRSKTFKRERRFVLIQMLIQAGFDFS
jgi:hypothetical protein